VRAHQIEIGLTLLDDALSAVEEERAERSDVREAAKD
jgi:hypothetical protein